MLTAPTRHLEHHTTPRAGMAVRSTSRIGTRLRNAAGKVRQASAAVVSSSDDHQNTSSIAPLAANVMPQVTIEIHAITLRQCNESVGERNFY